mmetsp:Transcript_141452/g.368477  ORF Transcript_141452/g.368477 Transcript_141452/m.368477 type:complete len:93 (-) Transcript_141452:16-294(-)
MSVLPPGCTSEICSKPQSSNKLALKPHDSPAARLNMTRTLPRGVAEGGNSSCAAASLVIARTKEVLEMNIPRAMELEDVVRCGDAMAPGGMC